MNKSEMRQGHVELWTWLEENPDKEKDEWPEWDNKYERSENLCFACEVAKDGADELDVRLHCRHCPIEWSGDDEHCRHCPIEWSGDDEHCRCLSTGAEYFEWAGGQQCERAELAKKIAGMWPEEE